MNKNTIIGFVLIGVIMFGFSWYQSNEHAKQVAEQQKRQQEQLLNQALEPKGEYLADSLRRAQGIGPQTTAKVVEEPVYTDTLLSKETLTDTASIYRLSNSKVQLDFTTKGAQIYAARLNDYKAYGSDSLYLIKPGGKNSLNVILDENINLYPQNRVFKVVEHTDSLIVMQLPFLTGGYIQQKYWLPNDSYMLQNELSFVGMDKIIPEYETTVDLDWTVTIPRLEKGYKGEKQ